LADEASRIPERGRPPSKTIREITQIEFAEDSIDDAPDEKTRYRRLLHLIYRLIRACHAADQPKVTDKDYETWIADESLLDAATAELTKLPIPLSDSPEWKWRITADTDIEYVIKTPGSASESTFRQNHLVEGSALYMNQRNERSFLNAENALWPIYAKVGKVVAHRKIITPGSSWSVDEASYGRSNSSAAIDKKRRVREETPEDRRESSTDEGDDSSGSEGENPNDVDI
jgi:hypothetical protein